jgi:hypothetical protein
MSPDIASSDGLGEMAERESRGALVLRRARLALYRYGRMGPHGSGLKQQRCGLQGDEEACAATSPGREAL